MAETTNTVPVDAAALTQLADQVLTRAATREQRYAEHYAKLRTDNRFANDGALIADTAQVALQDDQELRKDLLALDRTTDTVMQALQADCDRASRLPSAVDRIVGSSSETAQAVLLARLVDINESQTARQYLAGATVRQAADRYASLDDTRDGTFVAAFEDALLAWTTTDPNQAVALSDLKKRVRERQQARIPADLVASRDAARQVATRVGMWKGTLSSVPTPTDSSIRDLLRRHERDAVGRR